MFELKRIEQQILEIRRKFPEQEKELLQRLPSHFTKEQIDRFIEVERKSLDEQIEELEIRRRFILDRRESFIPKTIWNLVVPILVSVLTVYLIKFFFHI